MTNDEWQEIDRKIEALLVPMQQILAAAVVLLQQEDYTVRQANEANTERQRCVEIRGQAEVFCGSPHFTHLDHQLQEKMGKVAQTFRGIPGSRMFSWEAPKFDSMNAEELRDWKKWAYEIMDEFHRAQPVAMELQQKIEQHELLQNFGGHFRVMGSTGQAQYWVIRSDGRQRDADEVDYRKRYSSEGEKHWTIVEADELAISWFKGNTSSPHEFRVDKLPVSACTREQLETVARLEEEIQQSWGGRTGMSGTESPGIGLGWNLKPVPKVPDVSTDAAERSEPVDLSTVTTLFGVPVQRRNK